MEIFEKEYYKEISKFIEQKIPRLRENKKFEKEYLRLNELIEQLQKELHENEKEKFNEIIDLVYKTEEYYFAYSYLLGIKHGTDIKNMQ